MTGCPRSRLVNQPLALSSGAGWPTPSAAVRRGDSFATVSARVVVSLSNGVGGRIGLTSRELVSSLGHLAGELRGVDQCGADEPVTVAAGENGVRASTLRSADSCTWMLLTAGSGGCSPRGPSTSSTRLTGCGDGSAQTA